MHEMETAVRNGLPVTYFLLNNQRLGLIDRHAVDLNGGDPVSDGFHSVAWQQVAAAFGWRSFLVRDNNDLAALWPELNRVRRPTLVECLVPVDENSPDFLQIRDEMNQP
jgi:acetolactate synthase-1/2/3 large subunit